MPNSDEAMLIHTQQLRTHLLHSLTRFHHEVSHSHESTLAVINSALQLHENQLQRNVWLQVGQQEKGKEHGGEIAHDVRKGAYQISLFYSDECFSNALLKVEHFSVCSFMDIGLERYAGARAIPLVIRP